MTENLSAVRFFGPDNLMGLGPAARSAVVVAHRSTVAQHGEDPCARRQAAAHEAGHVVVAWALGETILGARITHTQVAAGRTVWLGRNSRSGAPTEAFTVACQPDEAFRAAAVNLAGFAGETQAKLSHPASSLDERLKAQILCEALDDHRCEPLGTHACALDAFVFDVLAKNRLPFDSIRGHLAARRFLTARDAARMLAGGHRAELCRQIHRLGQK